MIYYYDQDKLKIRLLQSKKAKLSTFKSNEGTIKAIINCSFFSNGYVIGRNQGDEKNDTVDQTNFEGNNLVIFKDGSYKIGKFNSWDYQNNVVAGFCPCAIFKDGQLEVAPTLANEWSPNAAINRTALCYNDNGFHFCVATSINYQDFANAIYEKYKAHFIAFLDSGGSSELIIDGQLQFTPSDNTERLMFNGLAFVETETPTIQKPIFPTKSTWISQGMDGATSHKGLKAIDFGTWSKKSLARLGLPEDYDYPITAPFDCKVVYRDYESKGALLVLESLNKVQYSNGDIDYCSVCIGHSNDTPALATTFKQGNLVCHFGKAGTSAKHMHLEVIKGKFSEIYKDKSIATCKQSVGYVYNLENTIEPNKCLYLNNTYIEDNIYDWKELDDEEETPITDDKDIIIAELKAKISQLEAEIDNKDKLIAEQETSLKTAQNKLNRIGEIINE